MISNDQSLSNSREQILNLNQSFKQRETFYSNRSSCIFPIYFNCKDNDLHIVFLNYWTIKNKIKKTKLLINFRIYNKNGQIIKRYSENNIQNHNQYSIRDIINDESKNDFHGMVDVEIISVDNLKFSFPGIVGIYQTGDLFSAVHSAGRIRNSDEAQLSTYTYETNWSCKFNEITTPFFHFFIGNKKNNSSIIKVHIKSITGETLKEEVIDISHMSPFSSEIFLADQIFEKETLQPGNFIAVQVEHSSTFSRMIVGNYFKSIKHLEVTHSFGLVEKNDYCPVEDKNQIQSILNCYTDENLTLTTKVFPTNCPGTFNALLSTQSFNEKLLKSEKEGKEIFSTGPSSNSIQKTLGKDDKFFAFHFYGNEVPSRFNASFIYKVRDTNSPFSTDIASGAKSSVYPPKFRHWGHAYVENGYETSILIRNNSHKPTETKNANGTLKIFSNEESCIINFKIQGESSISIPIHEKILNHKNLLTKPNFLSWIIDLDVPTCETFWICFRKTDGAIFGEHGF